MKHTPLDVGIVGCSFYIFDLTRSIDSKWQFLDCATLAFSERYVLVKYNLHKKYIQLQFSIGQISLATA
jgi:hypothetical protein